MRIPSRSRVRGSQVVEPFTLPPPVGGLNAFDAITDMPETDALILDNFFCQPDWVELRRGHESYGTGMTTRIESMFSWKGPASTKLKAATPTNIYDISSAGAGSSEVGSLGSGQWQHVMMSNGAGSNYLVIANGADSVRNYDGTSWTTPTITGVTSSTLNNVAVHHRRLWFVEKDSTSGWYLATDSISGTATEFDFGPRWTRGGYLVAIASMSIDSGSGPDDYLVAISSAGEIAIYIGLDPASASTWASVGTFYTSPPIGKRCFEHMGGDLALVTQSGVLSVSALLPLDRTAQDRAAITTKIDRLINADSESHGSLFGWQIVRHPTRNMLIINVPTSATASRQYAMNTLTGGWSRFLGMDAACWAVYDDELYFGGTGVVYKADTGYQDLGLAITADMKPAFHSFGNPVQRKRFTQVRPFYRSNGTPGFLMSLNVDFEDTAPTSTPTSVPQSGSLWGAATWGVSLWESATGIITREWQGVSNIGSYASIRLRIQTDGTAVEILGFQGMLERGGIQ